MLRSATFRYSRACSSRRSARPRRRCWSPDQLSTALHFDRDAVGLAHRSRATSRWPVALLLVGLSSISRLACRPEPDFDRAAAEQDRPGVEQNDLSAGAVLGDGFGRDGRTAEQLPAL